MDHFYKSTEGESWFDYEHLYSEMVSKFPSGSRFVEIGTWKGRSACYMAVEIINSGKNIAFDCVDTWEYISVQKDIAVKDYTELHSIFLKNVAPVQHMIHPVKALSWEGANHYEDKSLDFVFIDAAHDYTSVTKDMLAWYPKIKAGGVIAGHDYHPYNEVYKAVNDFFKGKHNIIKKGSCWFVELPTQVTFDSYKDIKGYVINLDRERARYDVARKELTGLGFTNIHRWKATDYQKEDVETEMRLLGSTRLDRFYNCAEMSCLLSHFRIMHDFLASTDSHCLVFEDDVVAVPQFKEHQDFPDIYWGDFDLLSFGGPFAGPDYASWTPGKNGWDSSNFVPLRKAEESGASHVSNCCFWQSHAYILSRRGAYRLLQDYPSWGSSAEYRIPFMDVYMSSNRSIQNKLICYKPENTEQYTGGDRFGYRFRGIMFQRKEFTSTILAANK